VKERNGQRAKRKRETCFRFLIAIVLILTAVQDVRGRDPALFGDDLDPESLHGAIHRSLEFLEKVPPDRLVGSEPRSLTAGEVRESLLEFMNLLKLWNRPKILDSEIRSRFEIHRYGDTRTGRVLFTGYYQPVIEGSLVETPVYRYPIYRKPDDLVEVEPSDLGGERVVGRIDGGGLVPYPSRHEIDGRGALRGKGYEIAWVKDPIGLFFLHIQGSGLLRLEDGRLLPINYAASNGRPYRSIGKLLIDRGKIPEQGLSMQGLSRYLKEFPGERDALFAENEAYVFFRFGEDGPLGSLGVPLTAGRSIATDRQLFPKGAVAFIVSRRPVLKPSGELVGWKPFTRFVLNQDTGSAVRGKRRVDLYFGSGDKAGEAAGVMRAYGTIYFLLKKKVPKNYPRSFPPKMP